MVDVFRTPSPSVAPIAEVGARDQQRRRQGGAAGGPPSPPPRSRQDSADEASVMGIAADELTPAVERALKSVMGEYDRVRRELESSRDREVHLQTLADADPFLPVLGRRALIREIDGVLRRAAAQRTDNTFVCVSVVNGADIRRRFGLAAAAAAMTDVAVDLAAGVRASDLLGSLGGYDFGIVLTLADEPAADRKVERLMAAIGGRLPGGAGAVPAPRLAWGLRLMSPDDTAETLIELADRVLRTRDRGGA